MKRIDLTGKKFGRLTVIEPSCLNKNRHLDWKCRCDCGNITYVPSQQLRNGRTKSCGCLQRELTSKNMRKDIAGSVYGRLTVLSKYGLTNDGQYLWKCVCECGNKAIVRGSHLRLGRTNSCGCYQREQAAKAHWKGGISYLPYCHKFNESKKEEIRNKYNRQCFICGKKEEDNINRLGVHHVDYNKDQGCNGNKWVLVPLCNSCHMKTNHNRTAWQMIIMHKLAAQKAGCEI